MEEGGVTTADISLTINNLAPAADAGGSYTIEEGNGLSLNASASTDPGNDSLTYSWDLDNDGQYDDATGSEPTVSWATLANLGLPSNGTSLSIGVQVDDGRGRCYDCRYFLGDQQRGAVCRSRRALHRYRRWHGDP